MKPRHFRCGAATRSWRCDRWWSCRASRNRVPRRRRRGASASQIQVDLGAAIYPTNAARKMSAGGSRRGGARRVGGRRRLGRSRGRARRWPGRCCRRSRHCYASWPSSRVSWASSNLCPYRVPTASGSLLRSLPFRGAVKRLDTPRNGQRIGTCRSRSSFKLVGGRPRSGQKPDSDRVRPVGGQAPTWHRTLTPDDRARDIPRWLRGRVDLR
jgi:hypothetical protein